MLIQHWFNLHSRGILSILHIIYTILLYSRAQFVVYLNLTTTGSDRISTVAHTPRRQSNRFLHNMNNRVHAPGQIIASDRY